MHPRTESVPGRFAALRRASGAFVLVCCAPFSKCAGVLANPFRKGLAFFLSSPNIWSHVVVLAGVEGGDQ